MMDSVEDIAFSDWPGQPVDLSGSNPWLPAYGFQNPSLDKDDFLGNPDAALFLHGSAGQHFVYLETILEETSDDLRSESDRSGSRASPVGWLATDSESGSVIRVDMLALDEIDSGSESETACPAKRRRQDPSLLTVTAFSDDESSISRSSSLLQFENLEKQCQEFCSSSPSVFSSFSFDSLEHHHQQRKLSPDSLEQAAEEEDEDDGHHEEDDEDCDDDDDEDDTSEESSECDDDDRDSYYKTIKIDKNSSNRRAKLSNSDSLFYNATRRLSESSSDCKSDSESSGESEKTLQASVQNLKSCRSFDCLSNSVTDGSGGVRRPIGSRADKISAENLSEDSGYSDHFCNYLKKSSSIPNIPIQSIPFVEKTCMKYENSSIKKSKKRKISDNIFNSINSNTSSASGSTITNSSFIHHNLNRRKSDGFDAYDGEVVCNFASNFGSSYQDLTVFNRYDLVVGGGSSGGLEQHRSPLIDRFMRNSGAARRRTLAQTLSAPVTAAARNSFSLDSSSSPPPTYHQVTDVLNLESSASSECGATKFNGVVGTASASEPNLLDVSSVVESANGGVNNASGINGISNCTSSVDFFGNISVPKDLNLLVVGDDLRFGGGSSGCQRKSNSCWDSIAAKNWDLGQLQDQMATQYIPLHGPPSVEHVDGPSFRREGSYIEAMSNLVDMSDDERSIGYKENTPSAKILNFDSKLLKAISESSIKSFNDQKQLNQLDMYFTSTPINHHQQKRNVISTPNLSTLHGTENDLLDDVKSGGAMTSGSNVPPDSSSSTENLTTPRKSALVHRSTSTNGVDSSVSASDAETEKTLTSAKSYGGSTSSKGVHFCPVVSEVNWRDDSASFDDDRSSYSERYSSSSTPTPERELPPLHKPEPRRPHQLGTTPPRMSVSQPALDNKKDASPPVEYTFIPLNPEKLAISSPELTSKRIQHQYQQHHSTPTNAHQQKSINSSGGGGYGEEGAAPATTADRQLLSVGAMEPQIACRPQKPARASKFGGFLSRLSSFRFSTRKSDEKKKKKQQQQQQDQKKSGPGAPTPTVTKEDYIYIPLKGPPITTVAPAAQDSTRNGAGDSDRGRSNAVSKGGVLGKPPLPPLPPRIVGASVKRAHAPGALGYAGCRGIDSGAGAVPRNAASMEPMGLIETDLDTEVTVITSQAHVKTRSLMNLGADAPPPTQTPRAHQRPHKSMEFLLDKENLKVVEPPENELQKGTGERVMSEHQLRVQRSLQKLTVPEWYKPSQVPREGFLLKKHKPRETSWQGSATASKTPSLTSLGSSVLLSPTPHSQSFVRWSTSKLNSTASSPCASTRSSFNSRQPNGTISPSSVRSSFSYRQPYLGWRSQERLSRPRTPAERLATSLLSQQPQQQQENPEIQTSIKEVTSAIVHYVSGLRPEPHSLSPHPDRGYESQDTVSQRSRSASPRGSQKLCWLESSFVGTRPLDTPQTPVTYSESNQTTTPAPAAAALRLDLQSVVHNDPERSEASTRPSPGSATLEDVLDSLLGLPPSTRAPSPCLQETASANNSPGRGADGHQRGGGAQQQFRRRSEGSEPAQKTPQEQEHHRRSSLHGADPVLRCRYSRCGKIAVAQSPEGKAFKNCHNCSYTYCSRVCRRAHWEKHRKTCLFSRVGALCRQVLAAAKEQHDALHHISLIARRGYLSQGPGAVKCFFACPEAAEKFVSGGLSELGEPAYVPWADLMPSEMGPQLYAELVKTCKSYNPDTRLVLYVAVCVISEAPAQGAVKWERQLVSRCAKMRLSKAALAAEASEDQDFLLLARLSISEEVSVREASFATIQKRLRQRGVSLRRQYPDIYGTVLNFVEKGAEAGGDRFAPITFYPKDANGKNFTCVIMPEEPHATTTQQYHHHHYRHHQQQHLQHQQLEQQEQNERD